MAKDQQTLFQRLSKLFKSGPIVKRKIRTFDTTIAAADKTKSSGALLFQKSLAPTYATITSNAYNLSERLMRYQDFQEMEYCLHKDTKIAIPGGYKTIGQLAKDCEGKPDYKFIVYSYDHNEGRIIPALGKQARQTRIDHAYTVVFDNGQKITGTSNHRLMKRDGTFCKIEDLKPGNVMMPFYRKTLFNDCEGDIAGGEWIYSNVHESKTNGWTQEHKMIQTFMKGSTLTELETINYEHLIENNNNVEKRKDITFGKILETSENVKFDFCRLCTTLDIDSSTINYLLHKNGYQNFETFANAYNDRKYGNKEEKDARYNASISFDDFKVAAIEYYGVIPLYDLTVDGYKNFATDTVISHNTPEIAAAMDIYADETVAQDDKGRVLHIYSDNEKIKNILEDLFYNTLNVEFNLRSWARNLVKYGDFFLYNDVSPEYGVINAFPIPVNEIEREENYDPNDPFSVRFRWVTLGNRTLENWEVTHFRLLGNDMFLPYGSSVVEPARRIWRQLILIEDAMLVYRVVRAPERRVFYIDVANIPPENVPMYVEEQRKNLRTNQVVDKATGRLDLRYAPLSIEDDYFIPVRGGESGTKIDTLAGGQNAAAIEDVAYIQKKLFAALKVPRAYLGYDEMLSSKATLAQEDIRFSRTINVIQKVLISELNKLAIVHLYANGFDGEDLQNFNLQLSNPSTVAQQQKLELWRSKFEIAGTIPEGMGSKEFARKMIWGLTDEQIKEIDEQRYNEKIVDAAIEAAKPEESEGEEPADDAGEEPADDAGEEPADDAETEDLFAGDDIDEKEPAIDLLTSSDEPDLMPSLYEKDKLPVKPMSRLKKAIYDSSRRKKHALHEPDFVKMTSHNGNGAADIYDSTWMKSIISDPFKESKTQKVETFKTALTPDLQSTLTKMSTKLQINKNNHSSKLLYEEKSLNDEKNNILIIDED